MDNLVSSPLSSRTSPSTYTSPFQKPLGETQPCIHTLADITAQLLNEDEKVRFQCLACARSKKSPIYHRCQMSSKDFSATHKELFKQAREILLRKDKETPVECFYIVIRMFFCATHCKTTAFNQFFESIRPHWKGDGSGEEKELLEAIRQAYDLSHSAHSTSVVDIKRPSSPAASSDSGIDVEFSVTDAVLTQCSRPPPMGIERSSEHVQNLPEISTVHKSSVELNDCSHAFSVKSENVPTRVSPQASNNSYHPQLSYGQQSHESSQADTLLQVSLPSTENPIWRSPAPSLKPNTTISSPAPTTALPIRPLLKPYPPSRHIRRHSNPPPPRKSVDHSQEPTTNYAMSLESLNYCSPPSKALFDFTPPAPQSQAATPSTQTSTSNGSKLSLPFRVSDSEAKQRVVLNDQAKSESEPSVPRSRASVAVATVPKQRGPTPEAVHQVAPAIAAGVKLQISPSPNSYSLKEFAAFDDWDKCLNPMISRENMFALSKIPHLQGSRDDTFLEQIASSVAAAAPPNFQANKKTNGSAFGNRTETERISQPLNPSTIDYLIRKSIMNSVSKEGYIYILKSPKYFEEFFPNEPPLLKIGMAKDVSKRMESLKATCDLSDLSRVPDCQDRPVEFYWKVEELVHCELQNFRRVFKCRTCKNRKGTETEHQEWFAVDEEVALRAVQRWRRFIEMEPYDENGILKSNWSSMLKPRNMEHPDAEEQWHDSQSRDKRWTKWLDEAVKKDEKV